ncbi:MAG: AAA family ATPase [Bacteroidales bacterium]|nr:AAA family ATPase [Bacteroidales bacterium]
MANVKDIISSIFRKYANEELSPEFIRDESNEVCDILEIPRIGDPGRTAREFAEKGYVSKYNGICKYTPNAIRLALKDEFESYEYVYDFADFENKVQKHSQKKLNDLLVQIKKIIENAPDKRQHIENELNLRNSLQTSSLIFPLVDEDEFVGGLTDEQILDKLAERLKDEHDKYKVKGYPFFGFKYGHIIAKQGLSINKIVKKTCSLSGDIRESLHSLIRHGVAVFKFASREGCLGDATVLNVNTDTADYQMVESDAESMDKLSIPPFSPSQIIYYGVPGSGKSNKIKELLKNVPDERKERVVFHPEYTNADFVGQILPVVHDGVDYKFTPGPFTKMVAKAYKSLASENPEQFYLVIEEINRGNAAAIFGDVFQLLDRIKPGETDSSLGNNSTYTEWWSQYFVYNEDINSKILEIAGASELKMGSVIFTKDSGIRLPPNLNILATMNTSDQNVFTLDNAFQRRFDMELVRNEFEKGDVNGFKDAAIRDQHDACIEGTGCTWGDFWEKINAKIVSLNRGLASTEDKRLGPWFVCSVAGDSAATPRKIPAKVFAEKVLKYLWDDAFKFKRPQVFAEGLTSLEQVVKKFEEAPAGNLEKLKAIFKEY